jgi:hypothetical protein
MVRLTGWLSGHEPRGRTRAIRLPKVVVVSVTTSTHPLPSSRRCRGCAPVAVPSQAYAARCRCNIHQKCPSVFDQRCTQLSLVSPYQQHAPHPGNFRLTRAQVCLSSPSAGTGKGTRHGRHKLMWVPVVPMGVANSACSAVTLVNRLRG